MDKCKEFRQFIVRNFCGDLNKDLEVRLSKHIKKCESCKKEFMIQKELESILKKRPELEAPENIVARVLSIIPDSKQSYEFSCFNWRIVISAACTVIAWFITIVTVYYYPKLKLITLPLRELSIRMTKFTNLLQSPYFLLGVVIYSIVFSGIFVFFFWQKQIRENKFFV